MAERFEPPTCFCQVGVNVAGGAEPALLGALLWDPQRAHEVAEWLRGDDFQRPVHAAIDQTITGLQADG